MFSIREFIRCGGLAVAALTGSLAFIGPHSFSRLVDKGFPAELVFDTWNIGCGHNAVVDKGFCLLSSAALEEGPFGKTSVHLPTISTKHDTAYFQFVELSFGWTVTNISVRFDDGPTQNVVCSEDDNNFPSFEGQDQPVLNTGLRKADRPNCGLKVLRDRTMTLFTISLYISQLMGLPSVFPDAPNEHIHSVRFETQRFKMPKTIRQLIDEVLEERAQAVTYSPEEIQQKVARLKNDFARIDATAAERRQIHTALQTLPPERRNRWLQGVQSMVQVVVDEAHRGSRIVIEAARDLLPASPNAWAFSNAGGFATRAGVDEIKKVEAQNTLGATSRTMFIDEGGSQTRLVTDFRGVPIDEPPPVQLIIGIKADDKTDFVVEVDPEIIKDPSDATRHRLRYEAIIPPGDYKIAYGNPRTMNS